MTRRCSDVFSDVWLMTSRCRVVVGAQTGWMIQHVGKTSSTGLWTNNAWVWFSGQFPSPFWQFQPCGKKWIFRCGIFPTKRDSVQHSVRFWQFRHKQFLLPFWHSQLLPISVQFWQTRPCNWWYSMWCNGNVANACKAVSTQCWLLTCTSGTSPGNMRSKHTGLFHFPTCTGELIYIPFHWCVCVMPLGYHNWTPGLGSELSLLWLKLRKMDCNMLKRHEETKTWKPRKTLKYCTQTYLQEGHLLAS